MSRRNYAAVAAEIREAKEDGGDTATLVDVTYRIASVFAQDNPRLDRERFIDACGFDPPARYGQDVERQEGRRES
jgi:hypothetical protein